MIIVRLSGGMGNQMFQYAHGRALSLKFNVPLKLDTTFLDHRVKMPHFLRPNFSFRSFDLDVFNIKAEIANKDEISFWNRPFFKGKLMILIDGLLRKLVIFHGWENKFSFNEEALKYGPNTYLVGYWQSEKYFKSISQIIREDFQPKDELSDAAKKVLSQIEEGESVCIHMRQQHGGGDFHTKYDMNYYEQGLNYISNKKEINKIFVFSDDINWCKENIKFNYPTVFVGRDCAGKKNEGDLFLMSKCSNFIIPNSTFSWWGAWLNSNEAKIVICPKNWFNNKSINTSDLIPAGWVQI